MCQASTNKHKNYLGAVLGYKKEGKQGKRCRVSGKKRTVTSWVSMRLTSTSIWGQVCVHATYKKSNCVPQDRTGGSSQSQIMLSVTQIQSCLSSTKSLAYTNTAINEVSVLIKALMEAVMKYWEEDQVNKNVIFIIYIFYQELLEEKKSIIWYCEVTKMNSPEWVSALLVLVE